MNSLCKDYLSAYMVYLHISSYESPRNWAAHSTINAESCYKEKYYYTYAVMWVKSLGRNRHFVKKSFLLHHRTKNSDSKYKYAMHWLRLFDIAELAPLNSLHCTTAHHIKQPHITTSSPPRLTTPLSTEHSQQDVAPFFWQHTEGDHEVP